MLSRKFNRLNFIRILYPDKAFSFVIHSVRGEMAVSQGTPPQNLTMLWMDYG
jgi:hypothetical protein